MPLINEMQDQKYHRYLKYEKFGLESLQIETSTLKSPTLTS